MKVYRSDKNGITLIRILILLVTIGLDALAYTYLFKYIVVMYVIMGIVTIIGVFFASIYVPLYFKMISFRVSKEVLFKESGFFIKTQQTMKVSSVQYVTSIYVPLFRYVGFNFIIFNALGGHMIFSFLSHQDSTEILEYIKEQIK